MRILVPMLIGVQLVACPAVGQAHEASGAPGCGPGGNPTGGGYHGHVVIDPHTGSVVSVQVGRHLR